MKINENPIKINGHLITFNDTSGNQWTSNTIQWTSINNQWNSNENNENQWTSNKIQW